MNKCTKVIASVLVIGMIAGMVIGMITLCSFSAPVSYASDNEQEYERFRLVDMPEEGEEYIMLFNTTSGSETDISKFYSNTGTLAAMQAYNNSVRMYTIPSSAYENNRESILLPDEVTDSLVWECKVLSDGSYAFSNDDRFIQDNGSENISMTSSSNARGCAWTYNSAVGEGKYSYRPLRSVTGDNVIRVSASNAAFRLKNPDNTATDARNSNVYLYKETDEEVKVTKAPSCSPKPTSVPVNEEEKLVQILTCTDYQKWYPDGQYNRDDWDALQLQLRQIVDAAYDAGFVSPDFFLFGGDTSCLNSAKSSGEGQKQLMTIIGECWPQINLDNSLILQGNHDPVDTDNLAQTGAYEYDDFIVYMLNEDDFPTKQGEDSVKEIISDTADSLESYLNTCISRGENRPVIIASHTGLHYDIDRTDGNNQFAYIISDVVNEAAKDLDIIFMFGHNHTNGDEQVGGSITFYSKGEVLPICHEDSIDNKSGSGTKINFTYMNYGYVGYIGDINNNISDRNPTDILTVSAITIYRDRIEIDRYSKDGFEKDYCRVINRDHRLIPTPSTEPVWTPAPPLAATPAPTAISVPTATPTPAAAFDNSNQSSNAQSTTISKTAVVSGAKYKIISVAAVEYKKPVSKKVTSVTIPDKVTISGKTYKVTGVSTNAFSGCKRLKKVTVGKNVSSIGNKAFHNCKTLKTVVIKSTAMGKVGKNALKGINAKAVVKVPKKKIVLYKKLLKGKGQKNTVCVK